MSRTRSTIELGTNSCHLERPSFDINGIFESCLRDDRKRCFNRGKTKVHTSDQRTRASADQRDSRTLFLSPASTQPATLFYLSKNGVGLKDNLWWYLHQGCFWPPGETSISREIRSGFSAATTIDTKAPREYPLKFGMNTVHVQEKYYQRVKGLFKPKLLTTLMTKAANFSGDASTNVVLPQCE
jgi:hypothetical protein